MVGEEDWIPTANELTQVANLFNQADLDPTGATVATRNGISVNEVRQGGEFWKISDVADWTTSQKMRAFGISDAFLSGEANYSTVDQAMSVFMDNIRTERGTMTRELFYEKIFPAIAIAHNFRNDDKRYKEISSYQHSEPMSKYGEGRRSGVYQNDQGQWVGVVAGNKVVAKSINDITDITKYIIPEVHWHKQLRPEGDASYLQMLDELTQKGVPVPLRMVAAAGGIDIDKLLAGKKEDLNLREKIQEYMQELQGISGTDQEGQEEASLNKLEKILSKVDSTFGSGIQQKSFADRDFDDRMGVLARDGKGNRRVITGKYRRQLNEKMNRLIAKSAAENAAKQNYLDKQDK